MSDGVALVGQTGAALRSIVGQVTEIAESVASIASAAQEQASGLTEVSTAVNQLDHITQQNAAMVEQATAASHSLRTEAATMAGLLQRFRVSETPSETVARRFAGSEPRLIARSA